MRQGGDTWIRRREGRDIWRNLYELPLIETDEEQGLDDLQRSGIWAELFHDAGQVGVSSQVYSCKHVLSHRIIHARFYMVETEFGSRYDRVYEDSGGTVGGLCRVALDRKFLGKAVNELSFVVLRPDNLTYSYG